MMNKCVYRSNAYISTLFCMMFVIKCIAFPKHGERMARGCLYLFSDIEEVLITLHESLVITLYLIYTPAV